tara:strand:- start:82 stop:264 length:183 start_codon:yes stop_codon:yes gene_type:complete
MTQLLALTLGNLKISNLSAAVLLVFSILFVISFIIVSLKNDNAGMLKWMFSKPSKTKKES